MKPLLEVRDLSKSYAGRRVLGPVSFQLERGEFCAVTGPSGSGKSTFLNLVGFLDEPDGGTVFFGGAPVPAADKRMRARLRREHVGMIFQSAYLLPSRSVMENVLFRARYTGQRRTDLPGRAEALLDRLGLSGVAGQRARLLSGGEAQRAAIARALLTEPSLLLADEPTGNLDASAAEEVMHALTDCAARGVGVLLVTHNPDLLRHVRTHVSCRDGLFSKKDIRPENASSAIPPNHGMPSP